MVKHLEGGSKRATYIAEGMHSTGTYYSLQVQGPITAPPSRFAVPTAHAAQPAGRSSWAEYLRSCFEGVRCASCLFENFQNNSDTVSCFPFGDCCSDVGSVFMCF